MRHAFKRWNLAALLLAMSFVFGAWRAAGTAGTPRAGGPLAVEWWSVDGGGGTSSGGAFRLGGSAGQGDAGTLAGGAFRVEGGFWNGGHAARLPVFIPLLSR